MLLLLLIFLTIDLSIATQKTCGEVYASCRETNQKEEIGEKISSFYKWATGGRSACEDAYNLCVYLNEKR